LETVLLLLKRESLDNFFLLLVGEFWDKNGFKDIELTKECSEEKISIVSKVIGQNLLVRVEICFTNKILELGMRSSVAEDLTMFDGLRRSFWKEMKSLYGRVSKVSPPDENQVSTYPEGFERSFKISFLKY